MLTHRVPYPPDRGDRIRAFHLLDALSKRYAVTLAAIADEPVSEPTRVKLESMCERVLIAHAKPMQRRASATRALLTGHAITPAAMYDATLSKRLVALHRDRPFDTLLTYCTGMIGYAQRLLDESDEMRCPRPRHVLDLVDVDSQKWQRYAEGSRGPMRLVYQAEARRLRAVEAGAVVPFDVVTVISEAESRRYAEHVTDAHRPVVVGNGVDMRRFRPATKRAAERAAEPVIVFTGVLSYKPNVDAAVWFAREVMPRVRSAVPSARFDIVGKSPASAVRVLDELPGVRVVGPVNDTADLLRASAVAVAPMRIAPGVQNKVLEAMACGLPVVCSSAAASGIDAVADEHLVISDTVGGVASRCVRLLLNPDERARLGGAARYRVQQRYDWAAAAAPMIDLVCLTSNPTP